MLQQLFDRHEALPLPHSAQDDALDGLIFLIADLNEMVLAYLEAMLMSVDPKFDPNIQDSERLFRKLMAIDGLNGEDQQKKQQLEVVLRSLLGIRDHLKDLN